MNMQARRSTDSPGVKYFDVSSKEEFIKALDDSFYWTTRFDSIKEQVRNDNVSWQDAAESCFDFIAHGYDIAG